MCSMISPTGERSNHTNKYTSWKEKNTLTIEEHDKSNWEASRLQSHMYNSEN